MNVIEKKIENSFIKRALDNFAKHNQGKSALLTAAGIAAAGLQASNVDFAALLQGDHKQLLRAGVVVVTAWLGYLAKFAEEKSNAGSVN